MPPLLLNPSVLLSPADDGYHAYDIHKQRLFRLNPTAALLVELCDGQRGQSELLDKVGPLLPESALPGCAEWLKQAVADQLLLESLPGSPSPPTAEELQQMARDLRRRDQVLAAFICQQRATELAPDDPNQWYALGEIAHIVGRRELARIGYERYQRAHPDDIEIEHLLIALRDEAPPSRASDAYIQQLYSYFAAFYEKNMCDDLEYRAPQLLLAAIDSALADDSRRGPLNVLELGCGTGLFGQLIRPMAERLCGIDLSADMIARARDRKLYDRLETAELTAWLASPPAETFDLVAICDTLIYFGDLRQVIPPAARILAAGGLLAFTVEVGAAEPFRLTDSGRFAHHQRHVLAVAREAGLAVISQTEETLRYEYGQPVQGWVTVLRDDNVAMHANS